MGAPWHWSARVNREPEDGAHILLGYGCLLLLWLSGFALGGLIWGALR